MTAKLCRYHFQFLWQQTLTYDSDIRVRKITCKLSNKIGAARGFVCGTSHGEFGTDRILDKVKNSLIQCVFE